MTKIGNDWDIMLRDEFDRPYFKQLENFLTEERARYEIYPPQEDVFNALRYSSFQDTKVVILGQDPYHEPGQAHGLCFSVNKGVTIPPSLVNIYKEIENDLGIKMPGHGYLADWAKQGVLLLNTVLTVRRGQANSHKGKGWEISYGPHCRNPQPTAETHGVYPLGSQCKVQDRAYNKQRTYGHHGSPSKPPFGMERLFGGRYFSKANRYLEITGQEPVDWGIL